MNKIAGKRKRFRIVNKKQLLRQLGMTGKDEHFMNWCMNTINSKSECYMIRQKQWSEALTVGNKSWIDKIKGRIGKKRLKIVHSEKPFQNQQATPTEHSIQEKDTPYMLY